MSTLREQARRRGVRILGFVFLALFLLLGGLVLTAHLGLRGQPAHFQEQQSRIAAMPAEQRAAVSTSLRNRVTTQWSEGPDNATTVDELLGQRTSLEIPYEELNIWIAEEGIGLLEEVGVKLPRSVRAAMVDATDDGLLRISCDIKTRKTEQIVSLAFDIKVADDGIITSRLEEASAGRLPIPAETALDLVANHNGSAPLLDFFNGSPTGPIDLPIDPTDEGLRDGRLVGLEVTQDAMIITRETVRRTSVE